MTPLDIMTSAACIAFAGAGVAYVAHIIRTSGRDRHEDALRVQHVIESAPYERLDNVIAKRGRAR